MKTIIYALIIALTMSVLLADVIVDHVPPLILRENEITVLKISVAKGYEEIESVAVFYKSIGEGQYSVATLSVPAIPSNNLDALIPSMKDVPGVEYFFQLGLKDGRIITLPEMQPRDNPYLILADLPDKVDSGFVKLSPEGDTEFGEDVVIAVSYFSISDKLDANSIALIVDGEDVSKKAQISSGIVLYKMKKNTSGSVSFSVTAKTIHGKSVSSPGWNATVKPKAELKLPMNITGDVTIKTSYKNASFDEDNSDDETIKRANMLLQVRGSEKWFKFASRVFLSSLNTSEKQPFHRYTLEMEVPHFKLVLGDTNPYFSTFSFAGKNLRGVSAKLDYQVYRLNIVYGSVLSVVDGKKNDNGELDRPGTFLRNSFGIRQEVGEKNSFVWGLDVVRTKDAISSLDEDDYISFIQGDEGTIRETPKDNLILSTDFVAHPIRNRVKIGASVSMSFYNNNIIGGAIPADSLKKELDVDSLPFDPEKFEWLFIMNKNIQPIKPGESNLAYELYGSVNIYRNFFSINYSQVGPAFYSIVSENMLNDIRKLSVTDNVILFKNKMILTGGINVSSDNVIKTKQNTTDTVSLFANVFIRPANLPYFRFGFNSSNSETGSSETELNSFNVSSGYKLKDFSYPTDFRIDFWNSKNSIDYSDINANSISLKNKNLNRNIALSTLTEFTDFPMSLGFRYTLATTEEESAGGSDENINRHTISLNSSFEFFERKMRPDFRISYMTDDSSSKNNRINLLIGSAFNFLENTDVYGSLMFNDLNTDEKSGYNEWESVLTVRYKF
ncbi:MAG: hypothetical protein PHR06_01915 [Candidatus Cloacimonetes bacterium]|nr:hypothetical protein [Candidatus Cloacimonadota bacterium]